MEDETDRHVACISEVRNAYNLVIKPESMRPLGTSSRWDFKDIACKDVD